jgi:flagellar biosynthetic protein FlhB
MADSSQRTEQPTQRRLEKARKDGQFPVSREFVAALQFAAFVAALSAWGPAWCEGLKSIFRELVARAFTPSMNAADATALGRGVLARSFMLLAPTGGVLLIITVAVQLVSTGMGLSLNKLAPDLKRLSPLGRVKNMPGENFHSALQALVLLPVFGAAVYAVARDNFDRFLALPFQSPLRAARETGAAVIALLWKAAAVFLVLGCADFVRQRRRWTKDLRMSKQEIREEHKENEGNPQVKGRIRRIQRDLARRRMMQAVPTATAVVVNPTHYAVAMRYVMESMAAPVVVAKGRNYLALRIRERAREHGIPIVENPPLAQALYKSAEVGQEIPAHLYRAVAEILAYIYRLTRGSRR